MSRIASAVAVLFLMTSVFAVEPEKTARTLRLRHHARQYVICGVTCPKDVAPTGRLEPEIRLVMRNGESIEVWVDDPNPLLYTYTFGGIEQIKNADVAAVEAFATQLSLAAEALSSLGGAVQEKSNPAVAAPDLLSPELMNRDAVERIQSIFGLEERMGSSRTARIRAATTRIAANLPVAQADRLKEAGITPEFLEAFSTAISSVAAARRQIAEKTTASADPTQWETLKDDVAEWKVATIAKTTKEGYKKLEQAFDRFNVSDTSEQNQIIRNALAIRAEALGYVSDLESFQSVVGTLGVPLAIKKPDGSRVYLDFDTLNDQKFSIDIAALTREKGFSSEAEDLLKKREVPIKETVVIAARPYHNVRVSAATAVVYSFVKNPSFVAEKSGDTLVIKEKDADRFAGQDVGLMLHLTPRAWDDPFFGGEFQLGITPVVDRLAAYLGGGITFKKFFSFGVGAVVQRVDRLSSGLKPGDPVASQDAVKTEKHWKPGAYIHLSIEFKNPLKK